MCSWIQLCRNRSIFVALDTLMLPALDTPLSPMIHLCRPGYNYGALDTPMSP
jgi:hypothetical protein